MRLWELPARALPVTLRPFGRETIPSYTRRLAEANSLPATTVLRALGDPQPVPDGRLMTMDAVLNRAATNRLEALTQISRHQLIQALPALGSWHHRTMPATPPTLLFRRLPSPALPACHRCVQQRATSSGLIHPTGAPMVCRHHRRWLGHHQYDLHGLPQVLDAYHRYQRILDRHSDHPTWIEKIIREVNVIIAGWGIVHPTYHSDLIHRWNLRAERLVVDVDAEHTLVTLPETVTLIEILSDQRWRRDLALLEPAEHHGFYRHVAARTGATEKALTRFRNRIDPLRVWVNAHHREHRELRFLHESHPWELTIGSFR